MLTQQEAIGYRVSGISIPDSNDSHMGMWGFSIELDSRIARQLTKIKLEGINIEYLQERAKNIIRACCGRVELFIRRRPITFYNDSILLRNITVPGDACGLDAEHTFDFHLKSYCIVSYHPHNVDHIGQAYALMAIWVMWYNMAFTFVEEL